ncbi:zinc metalloproteinase nas-4-like [Tubulanus polymorphus]|uniref:zinc metalloproteinase nas-4-like n=1 Tax=Tubulanus polymorphus TaxID=672921 RepID=UPI003DA2C69B
MWTIRALALVIFIQFLIQPFEAVTTSDIDDEFNKAIQKQMAKRDADPDMNEHDHILAINAIHAQRRANADDLINKVNAKSGVTGMSEGDIAPVKRNNADDIINEVNEHKPHHTKLSEGDIVTEEEPSTLERRSSDADRRRLWKSRVVPYTFEYSISSQKRDVIKQAMAAIERATCIRYRPRQGSDKNFLKFFSGDGCYSSVGMVFWKSYEGQKVSIGEGCQYVGTIVHEMTHALGFYHEQSRSDRDKYVEIFWENIEKSIYTKQSIYVRNSE